MDSLAPPAPRSMQVNAVPLEEFELLGPPAGHGIEEVTLSVSVSQRRPLPRIVRRSRQDSQQVAPRPAVCSGVPQRQQRPIED